MKAAHVSSIIILVLVPWCYVFLVGWAILKYRRMTPDTQVQSHRLGTVVTTFVFPPAGPSVQWLKL